MGCMCAVLFLGFYVYRFGAIFALKNIHIAGASSVDEETLRTVIYNTIAAQGSFFKNNGLLVRRRVLEERVQSEFAAVGAIDIRKEFFSRTLAVKLSPKEEVGIACKAMRVDTVALDTSSPLPEASSPLREILAPQFSVVSGAGACRWFDNHGILFKEAPDSSGSLILKVLYGGEGDLREISTVLNEDMIRMLRAIKHDVRTLANLEISYFLIPQGYYGDLLAYTPLGFSILFDPQSNVEQAFKNLKGVLATMSPASLRTVDRFDLTIENRIYTRYRTSLAR